MTDTRAIDAQTRSELEALLTEFAYRVDHGLAATVHELFTPDGSIRAPGLALDGREAIARQFGDRAADTRPVSRHFWSNPRFERLSKTAFRITTTVQTFIHRLADGESLPANGYTLVAGDSVDVIEAGADGCLRFRSRELLVAFRAEHG